MHSTHTPHDTPASPHIFPCPPPQVSSSAGGLLHEVYMHANGSQFLYLEGCFRSFIDGATQPTWLSSGTEDYFNSADYFNAGLFQSPVSGLTYFNRTSHAMSAYRVHDTDPVIFDHGFRLDWRNSDELPVESHPSALALPEEPGSWVCPFAFPWGKGGASKESPEDDQPREAERMTAAQGGLLDTHARFLVWVYEWPSPSPHVKPRRGAAERDV